MSKILILLLSLLLSFVSPLGLATVLTPMTQNHHSHVELPAASHCSNAVADCSMLVNQCPMASAYILAAVPVLTMAHGRDRVQSPYWFQVSTFTEPPVLSPPII